MYDHPALALEAASAGDPNTLRAFLSQKPEAVSPMPTCNSTNHTLCTCTELSWYNFRAFGTLWNILVHVKGTWYYLVCLVHVKVS